MLECELRFSPSAILDTGTFKLLELPPDIHRQLESGDNPVLTIKGTPDEDAVLCTADKTYTVRSVVLSNSVLVVTPQGGAAECEDDDGLVEEVFICDELNEVIELVPSVPRLHKLNSLLRGNEYDEGHEDEDMDSDDESEPGSTKQHRCTYEEVQSTIQASDAELDRGLRQRRVLILNGELRPIARSHLTTVLELILTNLVSLSLPHIAVPVSTLLAALEDEHDIRRDVARQVMTWFGSIKDESGTWEMEVDAVVREIGLGILRAYRDEPAPENAFLEQWRKAVGDTFQDKVVLWLLSGNYLTSTDALSVPPKTLLAYFPSSELPVDPGARFSELFLARSRWKADEIVLFLSDISVDSKERDKLLLKHARTITNSEGIWYTARAKYNG